MIKYLSTLVVMILSLCLIAQEETIKTPEVINELGIIVFPAKFGNGYDRTQNQRLTQKVSNAFSKNGIFNDRSSVFGVLATATTQDEGKIEGMKTLYIAKMELNLVVKNLLTGQVFSSETFYYSSTGKTIGEAAKKSINAIKPFKMDVKKYIMALEEKMEIYYTENCAKIKEQAQKASSQNQYKKAIALLSTIPKNTDCYTTIEQDLDVVLKQYYLSSCNTIIQKAEYAMIQKKYDSALKHIAQISPDAPCAAAAAQALAKIEKGLSTKNKAKAKFLAKVYKDNLELEKAKIQARAAISQNHFKEKSEVIIIDK